MPHIASVRADALTSRLQPQSRPILRNGPAVAHPIRPVPPPESVGIPRFGPHGSAQVAVAPLPLKPVYQRLIAQTVGGFTLKRIQGAGFECPWHTHPELELIFVLKSNGYRIVGDHIAPIVAGDMVLLGSEIPHIWKNDPGIAGQQGVDTILLQFDPGLFGEKFLGLPAFVPIRRLFERASRGLHIYGSAQQEVADRLKAMLSLSPFLQFVRFLEILGVLAESTECSALSSPGWTPKAVRFDQERMNRVLGFIHGSYDHGVRLGDAAKVVNLSPSAFSRFFRLHTGKTFPAFINELRIGRACRLLIETDKTVIEISYECGFSTLSNFNRQFLHAKGVTPRAFRRQMQNRLEPERAVATSGPPDASLPGDHDGSVARCG